METNLKYYFLCTRVGGITLGKLLPQLISAAGVFFFCDSVHNCPFEGLVWPQQESS